ncbi:hypothetical protein DOTSEDRAFT_21407 [Dothistroma septosporum NZE10]|uniref:Uncharacterized protein n=1 Tax=Dothistroma septosporum (strain NZE10 / CBS 128990) TaxID=675120 RepID=N1PZ54_DOTSN|nr:hypothetical protein DOTSEDRAFT_21407 [Dothistroma septosporum NZE10]
MAAEFDAVFLTLAAARVEFRTNAGTTSRVTAKIDAARKASSIFQGATVSHGAAAKLPYLQACLNEALRLWYNIAASLPRIVPTEGNNIGGQYIPCGYTVGMPERLFNTDEAQLNNMATRNPGFEGSSRKCPGENVARSV